MKKILIVDDEEEFCLLVKETLEKATEYETIIATDGKNGIHAVFEHKPDLILLDIMMPVMDGFEVMKTLKEDEGYKSIPILIITAMENIEDKVKGFQLGAADYITKPISVDELKARVRAHLRIKEAEEERIKTRELLAVKDMIVTYNHEMNQPLTAILGYLKLLMDEVAKDDEKYQMLQLIEEQTDKVVMILNKIKSINSFKEKGYLGKTKMIDLES